MGLLGRVFRTIKTHIRFSFKFRGKVHENCLFRGSEKIPTHLSVGSEVKQRNIEEKEK